MPSLLEVLGLARPKARSAAAAAVAVPLAAAALVDGQRAFAGRRFESQRADMKARLIDSARSKAADGDVSGKLTLKANAEAEVARAAAFAGKGQADFDRQRADALKAADVLDAHANKDSIRTAITDVRAKLAAADAHAARKEWPDGMQRAMEARVIAVRAKSLADEVATFKKARASVVAQVYGLDRFAPPADLAALIKAVNDNDDVALGPPPDVAAARRTLDALRAQLAKFFRDSVDDVKRRLASIDALGAGAKAAVGADLAKARALVAEAEAALAADEWARSKAAALAALDFLAPGERVAARREAFDTQRAAAQAAIAAVKARPEVQAQAAELDVRVGQADKLADPATRQYEQATRQLADVATRANLWLAVAPSLEQANTLRDAARKDLAALDTGPAAAATATLREAARAKLLEADNTRAILAGGNDPAHGAETVLTLTRRAGEDVAQAKALAAGLRPALDAAAAAGKAGAPAALRKALAALRADLATATAARPAAPADGELTKADAAAADCDAALRKKDGAAAAAAALKKAAEALAAARTAMADQQQAAALLAAVEARRQALGKLANAQKLKLKLDELDRALADARKASGADAVAAARRADDIAAAAERADADRKAFDTEVAEVFNMIAALTDPKTKADLVKVAEAAKEKASALKFAEATKAIAEVRKRTAKARVAALAAVRPPDAGTLAGLAKFADELAARGAGSDVDTLIEKLPAGTDPRTVAAIAKGRFGIEFTADVAAGVPAGQELASMQAICKMLAKVPQDVRGNKSLASLKHTDNPPPEAGGAYDQATAAISLNGRPKAQNQEFGANLKAPAGPPGPPGSPPQPMVSQLPADVGAKFKPADDKPVDVLDWSSLHEVGHGLDDKHTYMLRNQDRPDHGGWTSYGSNVQPIADVVGRHFKFDTTAEQRKYVRDMLMSLPPTDPPAPDAKTDWAQRKKDFDDWHQLATSENIYRRQGDCDRITIGELIYHEAYPRQWVSYLAAARKEGLTGYQFRHPGEWFSELYAGYKSGKLGNGHPARRWLATLSP